MSHELITGRWEDLQCVQALRSVGVNVPALVAWQPTGAGGLFLYEFTKNALKELHFVAQIPHSALNGSVIKPHVHFTPRTTTATGVVRWQMEYTLKEPNGTFGAPATIGGSYTFAANQQDKHLAQSIDSAAITLPATGAIHIIVGRLFRDGGVSPDTFAASVFLLGFDFHYQKDKNGTVAEFGP